jgi:hypothetical protein
MHLRVMLTASLAVNDGVPGEDRNGQATGGSDASSASRRIYWGLFLASNGDREARLWISQEPSAGCPKVEHDSQVGIHGLSRQVMARARASRAPFRGRSQWKLRTKLYRN